MDRNPPTIVILGASGLIGSALARHLREAGFALTPVARRFTPAQTAALGGGGVEAPIAALEAVALARLLSGQTVDVVVNCLGVLQDGPRGRTDDVHRGFVSRLVAAIESLPRPPLLVHISIPGRAEQDETAFSRTKREAERLIAASSISCVVLRPGFVVAPAAYGGGALIRALAALPLALPHRLGSRPFAATDVGDIARTVGVLARRWREAGPPFRATWDVMERDPGSVADVVATFRRRYGGPRPIVPIPALVLAFGARAGDLAALLGWAPPVRGTALREMMRGIAGDPCPWAAATGIEPVPLVDALMRLPVTVQDRWFSRLYLLKAVVIAALAAFWLGSGLIALTLGFDAATAILLVHGFPGALAPGVTVLTSLLDIGIGFAIATRPWCGFGLAAGIALSLAYLVAAAVLAPELWADPLGALVKTGPSVVLMLVALAILPER